MTLTIETLLLKLCVAAFAATSAVATTIHAAESYVMSPDGFTVAYKVLGPKSVAQAGNSLNTALGPSMGKSPEAIPNRLARGEPADTVIIVSYVPDDLIKQGRIIPELRVRLADSRIGMVVREGMAKSDISSSEALKHVLLYAKPTAYPDSASGVYIERELFKKFGIEEQVKAKAKMISCTPVVSAMATGDYGVGFQQVSELLPVPDATFVGKIPEPLQPVMRYAAGIPVDAQYPEEAKALLDHLAPPAVQADVKSTGLDSVSGQ